MIAHLLLAVLLAAQAAPSKKSKKEKADAGTSDLGLVPPTADLTPPPPPPVTADKPDKKDAKAGDTKPADAKASKDAKAGGDLLLPPLTPPTKEIRPEPVKPEPVKPEPAKAATAAPPAREPAPAAPPAKPPPAAPPAKAPPAVAAPVPAPAEALEAQEEAENDAYTPPAPVNATNPLKVGGYLDVGWARANGNGSSFPVNDQRFPADYGVDAFQPAVNSRGEVASVDAGGRFTNGFMPRSVNIGGNGSFLVNTVDVDVKYQPASAPVLLFVRAQLLPRFNPTSATSALIEQAFVRVSPFTTAELAIFAGRIDSVFGIEYNENEANLRTNITPSLVARYTTGQSTGVKVFYRKQLPFISGAITFNTAVTNSGNLVDSLDPPETSLTGIPVFSGRFGVELNWSFMELKLGASGLTGPRNDQLQANIRQKQWGLDARLVFGWLSLAGELVRVNHDPGAWDKDTGLGVQTTASKFEAKGGYATASFGIPVGASFLHKVTPYLIYSRRHAQFEGYTAIT
ncbi:MAG: hypothetical protein JST92_25420, partial [Deltaproteobacteria bacterium]|nr:hypothetical protein [Deltaproteobacteria bacterium]